MARTKAKSPEPAPVAEQSTTANENILTIRGKRAWKDWLERYAAFRRVKPTAMIDIALSESAAEAGFEAPPQRL